MKKRTLSFLLALMMCLSLLPMTALAAYTPDPTKFDAPIIADLAITEPDEFGAVGISFTLKNPNSIKEALAYYDEYGDGAIHTIIGQISIDGGDWEDVDITNGSWLDEGARETNRVTELRVDSYVKFRAYYSGWDINGYEFNWYGDEMGKFSNVLTLNEKVDINASAWALPELEKADELGLIPDCLDGVDLTADITRAEFAAVAVKVYEALSSTPAIPIVNNPFTDCNDVEVLKAYNIGAVNGTSATTYDPDALLNREQAATMLTRVFKKVTLAGWTLQTDSQFTLPYTKPAAFADDKDISAWAKDSVYFMAANGIINGVGGNKFAPKNTTTAQQANGYANATREQALLIAVRMVENLGK